MGAPPPIGGCMGGLKGLSGQITKYRINLDLIKIFQFCLMGGYVDGPM